MKKAPDVGPARNRARMLVAVGALGLAVVCPSLARAEPAPADKAMATQLFDDGQKLMGEKSYAAACGKFHESQRLDPQLGTQLHLADCYEKAGKTASAWAAFKDATEIAAKRGDARESVARDRAAALEARLARLTIQVSAGDTPGLEVRLDGEVMGRPAWGAAAPIDPGAHAIVVSATGHEPRSYDVTIAAAEQKTLAVALGAAVEAPAPAPAPPPVTAPPRAPAPPPVTAPPPADCGTSAGSSTKTLGYVMVGVGVVGVAVGAVTGAMVLGKKSTIDSECDANKACSQAGLDAADSARTLSTVSTVGFIVGAVGVGAGAIFIVSSGGNKAPRTALTTSMAPGGAGVSLVRTF